MYREQTASTSTAAIAKNHLLLLLFSSAKTPTTIEPDWSPSAGICHTLPVSAKELVTDSRTKRQHDIPGVDWWTWQVSRWSLLPSFECKLPDSLSCLSTPLEGWKFLLSSRTAYCHICTCYICDAVVLGHTESICSTKMLLYDVFLHQFFFPHLKKKHGIWLISSHQNCIWHLNRGLGKSSETVSANLTSFRFWVKRSYRIHLASAIGQLIHLDKKNRLLWICMENRYSYMSVTCGWDGSYNVASWTCLLAHEIDLHFLRLQLQAIIS